MGCQIVTLATWVGRELSFQTGDIIFVRRQIDKNWYEGEHNAMVGIFPVNYVEIVSYDAVRLANATSQASKTGVEPNKARVKFNFVAQTPVELSLVKGEIVLIIRQVAVPLFKFPTKQSYQ